MTMVGCKSVVKRLGGGSAGRPITWRLENLQVDDRERVMISGPSGCGKTTLLNLVSGILLPDAGEITVSGTRIDKLARSAVDVFRGRNIGVLSQSFQLLHHLSVTDNLLLASRYGRLWSGREARERTDLLLEHVGLWDRRHNLPCRLSIGEQQRVAVARSLINKPPLLLADEPTASLDVRNAAMVMNLLFELCASEATTLIVVTHDPGFADRFDRIVSAESWLEQAQEQATGVEEQPQNV